MSDQTEATHDPITQATIAQEGLRKKGILLLWGGFAVALLASALVFLPDSKAPNHSDMVTAAPPEPAQTLMTQDLSSASAVDGKGRSEVMSVITQVQNQYVRLAQTPGLSQWQPEQVHAFEQRLQQALSLYTQTQYPAAQAKLDALQQDMNVYQSQWEAHVQSVFNTAQEAFHDRQSAQAQLALQQLTKLSPNHPQLATLSERVRQLPQVVEAERRLEIAVSENNLKAEQVALTQLLAIDADNVNAMTRLTQIEADLQATTIADIVRRAESALQNNQYTQAQQFLSQLNTLAPNHPSMTLLQETVRQAQLSASAQQLLGQLTLMAELGDWQGIYFVAKRAIERLPNNASIVEFYDKAQGLQTALTQTEQFIAQGDRLRDDNLRTRAQTHLQTIPSGQYHRLDQAAAELKAMLEVNAQLYALNIRSDDATYISIRNRGSLGQIQQQTVFLPAGKYVIEAHRRGYRSKLVKVEVIALNDATPQSITVLCDEPIG